MMLRSLALVIFIGVLSVGASARSLPDFSELIENASPAVVKINTLTKRKKSHSRIPQGQNIPDIFRHFLEPRQMPERNMHSMGSGFFVSSDGYLLTNNHVIEDADEIVIRMVDRREYDATVIGTDPLSDLALLKIEETGLPFLTLADSKKLKVGEWVVAIGSPFGLDFSASAGIVSAIGRSIPNQELQGNYVPFIQTDVAINPGNSGGPLFNMDGEVVGVNSQIYTRSGGSIGLSFAIPANVASNVVSQLKDKQRVDRGWLGVVIQPVDKDLAESFGLDKPSGALIGQVVQGSPAEKSGLRAGDIVIKFNGIEIIDSTDLPVVVGVTEPGKKVPVDIVRERKKRVIKVTLGVRNDDTDLGSIGGGSKRKPEGKAGGRLGVLIEGVDSNELKKLRIKGGVRIVAIDPEGAAAQAGLRNGDIIAQLGFSEVPSVKAFKKVVAALPAERLLPIRFFSRGNPQFRTFSLEK
ncbi:MAG: serine peptidase [Alteromonadaceae bacterium]|nr:MAG: serine peptidase [Alteromonadaceae bacterium]